MNLIMRRNPLLSLPAIGRIYPQPNNARLRSLALRWINLVRFRNNPNPMLSTLDVTGHFP